MSITIDMAGRVVLVTGGTRGIGRGIAQRFMEAGATVMVSGRRTPTECVVGTSFVAADVRDHESATAMIEETVRKWGRLDVLINNAGGSPQADAATASTSFSRAITELNLIAPLQCAQLANKVMQSQETGGVIINISSVSGLRPSPGTAAYGAAKAGLAQLGVSLAVEWAPAVRVVCIAVGMVQTEASLVHYGGDEGIARVAATIPAGRMATPRDVGDACVFLASPLADYISGATLVLHGGGEAPAFLAAAKDEGAEA